MLQQHSLNLQTGKALLLIMLALLLLGALGVYWYVNPAQQPDWIAKQMPTAPDAEVTLYRWKNANGEWVASSEPPPAGVEFEALSYRHDTNLMPAVIVEDDD